MIGKNWRPSSKSTKTSIKKADITLFKPVRDLLFIVVYNLTYLLSKNLASYRDNVLNEQ